MSQSKSISQMEVPKEFFEYVGPADKDGNSLYKCLICPSGFGSTKKFISSHDRSRQNLKKPIKVSKLFYVSLSQSFYLM